MQKGVKISRDPVYSVAAKGTVGGLATGVLSKVWWHKAPWTVFYLWPIYGCGPRVSPWY